MYAASGLLNKLVVCEAEFQALGTQKWTEGMRCLPKWESPSRGAENACCCFHAWPHRPREEVTLGQRWAGGIGISQVCVPESGMSWYTSHICLVWGSAQGMGVMGARKAERKQVNRSGRPFQMALTFPPGKWRTPLEGCGRGGMGYQYLF